MNESEFDATVVYTLRIELLNGKVLKYPIDTENKQYLVNNLRVNADGAFEEDRLSLLWFETTYNRQVIVDAKSIVRVIFTFEPAEIVVNKSRYSDNFGLIENAMPIAEGSADEALPQAIIYHKGNAPEDNGCKNPLLYFSLNDGCLASFDLELEGKQRIRQFINLIDDEGEESFIPMEQIMVMEFDQHLFYEADEEYDEGDAAL